MLTSPLTTLKRRNPMQEKQFPSKITRRAMLPLGLPSCTESNGERDGTNTLTVWGIRLLERNKTGASPTGTAKKGPCLSTPNRASGTRLPIVQPSPMPTSCSLSVIQSSKTLLKEPLTARCMGTNSSVKLTGMSGLTLRCRCPACRGGTGASERTSGAPRS